MSFLQMQTQSPILTRIKMMEASAKRPQKVQNKAVVIDFFSPVLIVTVTPGADPSLILNFDNVNVNVRVVL